MSSQIAIFDLENYLQDKKPTVIGFYGNNDFLKQEAITIINKVFSSKHIQIQTIRTEALSNHNFSFLLFEQKTLFQDEPFKIIVLNSISSQFKSIFPKRKNENNYLILDIKGLLSSSVCDIIVDCKPFYGKKLEEWVDQKAKNYKLGFTQKQIKQIVYITNNEFSSIINILETFQILKPSQKLWKPERRDYVQVLNTVRSASIQQFFFSLHSGNSKVALFKLASLERFGMSLLELLHLLERHFWELMTLKKEKKRKYQNIYNTYQFEELFKIVSYLCQAQKDFLIRTSQDIVLFLVGKQWKT